MNPANLFWQTVHEVDAALPDGESHWVTPIAPPARPVLVGRRRAAILVAEGRHRLAITDEVAEHQRRSRILAGAEEARAEAEARKGGMSLHAQ